MQPRRLESAVEVHVEELEDERIGRASAAWPGPLDRKLQITDGAQECNWVAEARRVQCRLAVLAKQPSGEAVHRAALAAQPRRRLRVEDLIGPHHARVEGGDGLTEHRRAAPLPREDDDELGGPRGGLAAHICAYIYPCGGMPMGMPDTPGALWNRLADGTLGCVACAR